MKLLFAVALALGSITTACKDTELTREWPRGVEPRLAGFSAWHRCTGTSAVDRDVEEVDCGGTTALPVQCDDVVVTVAEARRLLVTQTSCTDAAVKALEAIALNPSQMAVKNDLAAAYYVRAQRDNRPTDFLKALDAVNAAPRSPESIFNRALIEEALALRDEAIASWDEYLRAGGPPDWLAEARQHRDALAQRPDGRTQWERINQVALADALDKDDSAAVRRLIAPFPMSATEYLETHELSDTAAKLLATEISSVTKDRYALDLVEWKRVSPKDELAGAHNAEGKLRLHEASRRYGKAAKHLERADPLALTTRLRQAASASPESYKESLPLLAAIEQEARSRGYWNLAARTHTTAANSRMRRGEYIDALRAFDESIALYRSLGNEEGIAGVLHRRAGTYRLAGATSHAWRDLTRAFRLASHLGTFKEQHNLFGEAAATALALGHSQIALLYQNTVIRMLEQNDQHSAVALRSRAAIEVDLNQFELAESDLIKARALEKESDPTAERILKARREAIKGKAILKANPAGAVVAFTRALTAASPEFKTILADLLAQRARARRLAGQASLARQDLLAAVAELDAEQEAMLDRRKHGEGEDLWTSYFSRFQPVYQALVRESIEQNRIEEALQYAEHARGREPLALAAERPGTLDLGALEKELAPGTYLLEYAVLEDRTIVWLVSRAGVRHVELETSEATVQRWTDFFQSKSKNIFDFDTTLRAAHEGLIDKVLAALDSRPERLIFIIDRPMQGLPLAALLDANGTYLIQRAPIEVAGSAGLYLFARRRDTELQRSTNRSVLLIGNPTNDLPLADLEVANIAQLYQPDVLPISHEKATVAAVLDAAASRSIIHIAAHSVFDPEAPFNSYVQLAPVPSPAMKEDGRLYAHDLVSRFHATDTRLVVLSSCSSAGGGPVGPEGVAPLVRPLIAARVPAVIGSLWDIKDMPGATAEPLLVSFHQHYRAGEDAAVALQHAQIEMLNEMKNAGVAPALVWGAFQVIGHSTSPFPAAPPLKEKPQ